MPTCQNDITIICINPLAICLPNSAVTCTLQKIIQTNGLWLVHTWIKVQPTRKSRFYIFFKTSKVVSWGGLSIVVDLEHPIWLFFYLKKQTILRPKTWFKKENSTESWKNKTEKTEFGDFCLMESGRTKLFCTLPTERG
jgi:hypothetical protein